MTRLAFSANAFKQSSLPDALDAIAAAGYAGAEVMADAPHLDPAALTPAGRAAVREMLDRRSLAASNVNAFTGFGCPLCRAGDDALGRPCGDTYHPTWIEDDPALVAWRVEHTIASIGLAEAIGAKTVSIQPGGPLIGTRLTREEASDRFAAALTRVLGAAGDHGVTVAVEPEPGLLIESAAESIAFKQTYFAADDRVRMNCDVGHLFCVGDDPAGVIREQAAQVAHVHLEDIGRNRVHQHLTPGRGAIDFPPILSALDDVGYGGWVTVELYPYESDAAGVARAAMEHLKPML